MNISEKMRMKMLVSGLRYELKKGGIIYVDKIRLIGSRLEVTYTAKLFHGEPFELFFNYRRSDCVHLYYSGNKKSCDKARRQGY